MVSPLTHERIYKQLMKIKICLLILVTTCVCKPKTNFANTNIQYILLKQSDSVILGRWTMCTSSSSDENGDGSMISRNVCIEWLFRRDHSGFVGLGKPILRFNWNILGNTLYIKNGNDFIANGAYPFTKQNGKKYYTIIITDTSKHSKYYLDSIR